LSFDENILTATHFQVRGWPYAFRRDHRRKSEDHPGSDSIFIEGLKAHGLYNSVWQAGAIFYRSRALA